MDVHEYNSMADGCGQTLARELSALGKMEPWGRWKGIAFETFMCNELIQSVTELS